jgi:hypothetical protein
MKMRTKMEKQMSWSSKSLLPSIPSKSIYGGTQKTKLSLITRDTSPSRENLEVFRFSSSHGCPATTTWLASTQALRSRRVSSASKHLGASDQGGQIAPLGRLDRPWRSDRPGRSDRPSWAVEPAWVAAPPRRVFGLGFVAQPSNPVVFW